MTDNGLSSDRVHSIIQLLDHPTIILAQNPRVRTTRNENTVDIIRKTDLEYCSYCAMPSEDKKRHFLSFLRLSKNLPNSQDLRTSSHDRPLHTSTSTLAPSAPIPLRPENIPLPQLGRGAGGTTSLYSTFPASFLPAKPTSEEFHAEESANPIRYSNVAKHYPSLSQSQSQSSHRAQTGTPDGLPAHLSLSTMGFGNSPFRVDYSSPYGPNQPVRSKETLMRTSAVWPPMDDFGRIITSTRGTSLSQALEDTIDHSIGPHHTGASKTIPSGEASLQSSLPALASAINIQESATHDGRSKSKDGVTASTWRMPRSISRTSLFETWGHSQSRDRPRVSRIPLAPSLMNGNAQNETGATANNARGMTSSISRSSFRGLEVGSKLRRKMSIDNIVQTFSRRRSQPVPDLTLAPSWGEFEKKIEAGPKYDTRRWTGMISETSDESIDRRAIFAAGSGQQAKAGRLVLPAMRSMRNKFSLGSSKSKDSSLSRQSGSVRLSAVFQNTNDSGNGTDVLGMATQVEPPSLCSHDSLLCTHANQSVRRRSFLRRSSEIPVQVQSRPRIDLSDAQAMVEITKTPISSPPLSLSQPTSPPARQSALVIARQASAMTSALTLPLSPARDDVSILDPHRTPMLTSFSVLSLKQPLEATLARTTAINTTRPRREVIGDTAVTLVPALANQQAGIGPNATVNAELPPSESRNVVLSTFSSVRTMSEFASSNSSESLAAKMKQSLSELKSAFKRMRTMSDLDLASISTSNRNSGQESEETHRTTASSASSAHEIQCSDANEEESEMISGKALSEKEHRQIHSSTMDLTQHARTGSTTNVSSSMRWKDSSQSFEAGKMSCAPSASSWYTAKEDLQVSIGDLNLRLAGTVGVSSGSADV